MYSRARFARCRSCCLRTITTTPSAVVCRMDTVATKVGGMGNTLKETNIPSQQNYICTRLVSSLQCNLYKLIGIPLSQQYTTHSYVVYITYSPRCSTNGSEVSSSISPSLSLYFCDMIRSLFEITNVTTTHSCDCMSSN